MPNDGSQTPIELEKNYPAFLADIKIRIRAAQYEALRAANKELLSLYWDIGSQIIDRQEKEGWGKSVVERLSKDLQVEFSGVQGLSVRNLWNMRNFVAQYQNDPKLQPLAAEISWTHNVVIMERCKDPLEREYYIRMVKRHGWSKAVLVLKIESKDFERTMINQTNFDKSLPQNLNDEAKLAVKDDYMFGFLELAEQHKERELENAIIQRVGPFLREMGGAFTFVGNQFKLEVGDKEFFIDILLYHRKLKCLVAIELKVVEFMPEHLGKMQFYLAALDDVVREEGENPSIGILLCKAKDRLMVEYTLKDINRPIGVATYQVTDTLPEDLRGLLPGPEEIAKLLIDL